MLAKWFVAAFASVAFLSIVSCTDAKLVEAQTTLVEAQVSLLNSRIDKLEVVEEEIVVKANSMNELELVVKAMEKRQAARLELIDARTKHARNLILQLESELFEKQEKMKLMEEKAESHPKTLAAKEKALDDRIQKLMAQLEQTISLKPRAGEEKVVLLERMLEEIKALRAENENLRKQIKK